MPITTATRRPRGSDAPLPLDTIADRLAAVAERSPADETELLWTETLRGTATDAPRSGGRRREAPNRRSLVQVRVRERGRVGFYRTGATSPQELDSAVRVALGQARLGPEAPALPLPGPGREPAVIAELHDPAVARLDVPTATDLLAAGSEEGDHLLLEWRQLRCAVINSRGLDRRAEATAVTLTARHGHGPGAGRAAASARGLAALSAPRVVERARRRAATAGDGSEDAVPAAAPLLLAPEAAASLARLLADAALTSRGFLDATSFLAGRLDQQIFDPLFTLLDDGTDPAGLPFPFDAGGWPKRRVVLVDGGVLRSPAVDPALGRRLGRTPTPHAVGYDESRARHLFVATGEAADDDLLAAADGGLWISALERPACHDPREGRFRAVARGVRRLHGGRLGAAVPDLCWEGELERVLAHLEAVGREPVVLANGAVGATSAPALALPATGGLTALAG